MKKHLRKPVSIFLNRIVWILSFFFLVDEMTPLHSMSLKDNWEKYQHKILEEQSNFSGWCPTEKAKHIMDLLVKNKSDLCVELGVFGGSSFFPIASTLAYKKQGIAYAIDPWTNKECLEGYKNTNDKHHKYWGHVDLDKVLYKFIENMHKNNLDSTYLVMRMPSAKAYRLFDDASIDFIHIDGNHSEQSATFDVEHWLPKVKKGGIVCFDDAWWESTQPAIKILLSQCDIMKESSPEWKYIFLRKQ